MIHGVQGLCTVFPGQLTHQAEVSLQRRCISVSGPPASKRLVSFQAAICSCSVSCFFSGIVPSPAALGRRAEARDQPAVDGALR